MPVAKSTKELEQETPKEAELKEDQPAVERGVPLREEGKPIGTEEREATVRNTSAEDVDLEFDGRMYTIPAGSVRRIPDYVANDWMGFFLPADHPQSSQHNSKEQDRVQRKWPITMWRDKPRTKANPYTGVFPQERIPWNDFFEKFFPLRRVEEQKE